MFKMSFSVTLDSVFIHCSISLLCTLQGLLQNVYLGFENSVEDILSKKGCQQNQGGRCALNNLFHILFPISDGFLLRCVCVCV